MNGSTQDCTKYRRDTHARGMCWSIGILPFFLLSWLPAMLPSMIGLGRPCPFCQATLRYHSTNWHENINPLHGLERLSRMPSPPLPAACGRCVGGKVTRIPPCPARVFWREAAFSNDRHLFVKSDQNRSKTIRVLPLLSPYQLPFLTFLNASNCATCYMRPFMEIFDNSKIRIRILRALTAGLEKSKKLFKNKNTML